MPVSRLFFGPPEGGWPQPKPQDEEPPEEVDDDGEDDLSTISE